MSMDTKTETLLQEECEDTASDFDVPVNKKTSFHGRLNQYFHTSKANVSSDSVSAKSTSSTDRVQNEDRKRDSDSRELESDSGSGRSKRRKATSATTTDTIKKTQVGRITRSRSTPQLREQPESKPEKRTQSQPHTSAPCSTSLLRDTIPPNLILLLVGVNPGVLTGKTGHAYAHPSNLFWKLLHWSGITPRRHPASDTYKLPELYNIGNTNIVERPTRDASMLSRAEMDAGVPVLEAKVARQRPECVCLVGKGIWEAIWRVRRGRAIRKEEFRYGWQDETENMGQSEAWSGARVFVATTTSGLAAGMNTEQKLAVWNQLGAWVERRRAGINVPPG